MERTNHNRYLILQNNIKMQSFLDNPDWNTNPLNKGLLRTGKLMLLILLLTLPGVGMAQVKSNYTISNSISNQNPFLDASTNFNSSANLGKGLVFPRTNLTTFTFKTTSLDGITFPTAFDGMLVYNTGTGNTLPGQGIVTAVTPGFYYFSNPNGVNSIANGKWMKIADKTEIVSSGTPTTAPIENNGTALATGGQIYDFTLQQISDSIRALKPRIFERELVEAENNINVGFALSKNTQVFYNGQAIHKDQWSGIGTSVIHLNLNTKLYDLITIK